MQTIYTKEEMPTDLWAFFVRVHFYILINIFFSFDAAYIYCNVYMKDPLE